MGQPDDSSGIATSGILHAGLIFPSHKYEIKGKRRLVLAKN